MYSGIYASVDLPPLFVVVPVACTLGGDAGRRIPIVCAHNPSLVRKHFAALRREIEASFGKLFEKLSEINK